LPRVRADMTRAAGARWTASRAACATASVSSKTPNTAPPLPDIAAARAPKLFSISKSLAISG